MVRLRVRKLLQRKGMTRYRLAKGSGLSLKTVYKLTTLHGNFDRIAADTIDRLCQALGCEPGELLERRGPLIKLHGDITLPGNVSGNNPPRTRRKR